MFEGAENNQRLTLGEKRGALFYYSLSLSGPLSSRLDILKQVFLALYCATFTGCRLDGCCGGGGGGSS